MKLCAALLLLTTSAAWADPSPAPLLVLPTPPSPFIGQLDVNGLQRAARRNLIVGNVLLGIGALIGGASTGLLITSEVRKCPANMPGCNDSIDTAGTYVGAASMAFICVGVTLFAVGITQRKIVKKLRAR